MNSNIQEYLKVLEEECGENKCHDATHVNERDLQRICDPSYARVSSAISEYRKDYKWRLKDRFKSLWRCFLERYSYLSIYNIFDFKSYEEEYNPYGFDIYAKIYKTSTPWNRLKRFCVELKGIFYGCIDAFFYTPFHIRHYQGNKKRIGWFEKNIWCWFSGSKKEKITFEDKLRKLGYTISENKDHIYYSPKNLK